MVELAFKYSSWPVAFFFTVVVSALIFRSPLGDAMRRGGVRIGREGLSIDQSGAEAASFQTDATSEGDALRLDPEIEVRRFEAKQVGISRVISEQQTKIKADLIKLGLSNDSEKIEILIKFLAIFQFHYYAERLYRIIFGSQIAVLKHLNVTGAKTERELSAFYDRAKEQYPQVYEKYDYSMYLGFLVSVQVVSVSDAGRYSITQIGKDFLQWIASEGVSDEKPF